MIIFNGSMQFFDDQPETLSAAAKLLSDTNPSIPFHFDSIEGGRDGVFDSPDAKRVSEKDNHW